MRPKIEATLVIIQQFSLLLRSFHKAEVRSNPQLHGRASECLERHFHAPIDMEHARIKKSRLKQEVKLALYSRMAGPGRLAVAVAVANLPNSVTSSKPGPAVGQTKGCKTQDARRASSPT
ncbi:hypothetical protein AC579_9805 [Pseudocercospora musae]|uniref:Uncharacterized protein n=1 Tax=Pseudocercospora musae TaxID=113226 RepID=A0A139IVQ9_9PEZI|nr:hypothetical protein AC579_9805 [Pseudocercospora musae]